MKINAKNLKNILKNRAIRNYKEKTYKEAAVFLLIFYEDNTPYFLTVLKADNKGYPWKNQIALPGGIRNSNDKSGLETAYREVEEELNISKEDIEYVCSAGYYETINKVDIQAFIGLWKKESELIFDNKEIAKIIKIPFYHLFDIHKKNNFAGRKLDLFELVYPYKDVTIWGVTARIFHTFLDALYSKA